MKLEHVVCDLCGSKDYIVRYRKPDNWLWVNCYEYPVVECTSCGLVYVNPRPTFDEMGKFYPTGYHEGRNDPKHLLRYTNQFDYIKAFNAKTFLDIGCARGDWLNFCFQYWPETEFHGVDTFSDGVIGDVVSFQQRQLVDAGFQESYFDLVTAWAVLEHVHAPSAYFSEVSKILKPGGKFVFLVTNSESIYGKYAYKEDIPRHLYHFNECCVGKYAEKYGMKLDNISYDERFWDGSGRGAFSCGMAKFCRIGWPDIRKNQLSYAQKSIMIVGELMDKLVFCCKWESLIKRSGIIVITLTKGD